MECSIPPAGSLLGMVPLQGITSDTLSRVERVIALFVVEFKRTITYLLELLCHSNIMLRFYYKKFAGVAQRRVTEFQSGDGAFNSSRRLQCFKC